MATSKIHLIDDTIYDMATHRQKEIVDACRKEGTQKAAAVALGIDNANVSRNITRLLAKAARVGYAPEASMTREVAEGFIAKRVSTCRDKNGEIALQWVIQEPDKEKQLQLVRDLTQDILKDLKPLPAKPFKGHTVESDLMVNIPIGDAHIGMLAWAEESGADYDLKIAEDLHCKAIDMLIDQTPNAENCTIIDLGDFMHSDNLDGTTSRSGNVLDMDGRYHKVIRVAIRITLYYINKALEKFKYVTFRPETGNHNDVGSIWMQELLTVAYENEPRVIIGAEAANVFFWQHGECYFMSHHGHQIKGDKLYQLLAQTIMDNHIKTTYRKIYLGHVHHKSVNENAICEIQTYRTLAAKDAYAATHGYVAGRSITAETWHKKYGEVSQVVVTIPMIEDNED